VTPGLVAWGTLWIVFLSAFVCLSVLVRLSMFEIVTDMGLLAYPVWLTSKCVYDYFEIRAMEKTMAQLEQERGAKEQ
jgi:hypothetical protein